MRPNLVAFGADQIEELKINNRYSDKYVFIISLSAIIQSLVKLFTLQNENYFVFYVFSSSMIFVSGLLFVISWKCYRHVEPYDSVLVNLIPVYKNAFEKWYEYRKNQHLIRRIHEEEEERRSYRFVDFAKVIHNGKFQDRIVDDVKALQNALIIFILTLPCWFIFAQVNLI